MDNSAKSVMDKRIERTIKSLQNNRMEAYYAESSVEALELIKKLCPDGTKIGFGGSMTLDEVGVMKLLRSGCYDLLDRDAEGVDPIEVMHQMFTCDTYFTSSNAITEEGELYNVDGNGNRVAAMLYGPKSVIVVAGYNKIVRDLEDACLRVRGMAAPANTTRLGRKTPCVVTGTCEDCHSEERICCDYVVMSHQRMKDRIKVIIVGEQLGY